MSNMLCPKCNFQNPEGTAVCNNCKISLSRRKLGFWQTGFFIELFLLVLFIMLIVVLTIDNLDLKSRPPIVTPQVNQPSPTPAIFPQVDSWKTLTSTKLGVTFQYPSNWELDDSNGSLWVKYISSENCEHLDPITCQYYGFYIEQWDLGGERVNTEDPALYLLENLLTEEQRIENCTIREGTFCQGEIGIPGWPTYEGRVYDLMEIHGDSRQILFPAVGISTMPRVRGDLQYLVNGNKRFYLIELAAPDLTSSADLSRASARLDDGSNKKHPIIQIIRSLRFL